MQFILNFGNLEMYYLPQMYAVMLETRTCMEICSGNTDVCSATARHLAEVRRQKSALHTATSHFYHDSYFRRFLSVYILILLLVIFRLWFVTSSCSYDS